MMKEQFGGIYIFGPKPEGPVKIGSTKCIRKRIEGLRPHGMKGFFVWSLFYFEIVDLPGTPNAYRWFERFPSKSTRGLEAYIHRGLKPWSQGREWFEIPVSNAVRTLEVILPRWFEEIGDPLGEWIGDDDLFERLEEDRRAIEDCEGLQGEIFKQFPLFHQKVPRLLERIEAEAGWFDAPCPLAPKEKGAA